MSTRRERRSSLAGRFSRLEPRLESRCSRLEPREKKKFSPTVHFSGYSRDECQTNDVHVFDFGMYTWSKPVIKGMHPSPRDSHSSTAVRSKLYVFGGTNGTSPLNDLFVLDNATNTWGKPDVFGDVPAPREGHSVSLIGDNLFVFGGYTFVWKKISTTGVSPTPQDRHTCSSYKNCFVVMGGEDGGNVYLNDVHILDTETMAWQEVKTAGAKLMPRARHTTISQWERRWQEYRAMPFMLDKQQDADKSLVSSHGEFQAHVQPLGEKMFEAR
ncbi:hypothetical protein SELMODRAFT_432392, partial [Selaginella moellendorffii]